MTSGGRLYPVLLMAVLFVACKRTEFPPLKNGEGLRADCAILMSKYPEGEIPSGAWPRSIRDLKATRVEREKSFVRIYVPDKRGDFKGGFFVFLDPQAIPPTQSIWIQKTEFKGIYQFRHY
jgi:hypothetical protein